MTSLEMSVRPSACGGGLRSLPIVDDESCDFLCKTKKEKDVSIEILESN